MAEYRVDELARAGGTSVRNVRAYQDRGLLEPPRRVGRTGLYSEAHLDRLRLIRALLQRGYTFATIGELLDAHSQGMDVEDLMRMHDLATITWSYEQPGRLSREDLVAAFGEFSDEDLARSVAMGFLVPDDDGFDVPSTPLMELGAKLVQLGLPLSAVLDLAEGLSAQMDLVADLIFRTLAREVATDAEHGENLQDQVLAMGPHAQRAVNALLALAMSREAGRVAARLRAWPRTVVDVTDRAAADHRSPAGT